MNTIRYTPLCRDDKTQYRISFLTPPFFGGFSFVYDLADREAIRKGGRVSRDPCYSPPFNQIHARTDDPPDQLVIDTWA
jgi:hypothetical protein